MYDERIEMENNGLFNGDTKYNKEYNNSNIESIENRTTSKTDVNLPTTKQGQQGIDESRQTNKENTRNSKGLKDSSFSLSQNQLNVESK